MLLPEIKRNGNGHRYYDESNLKWIALITCLKNTNMPIEFIKIFVELHNEGDKTLNKRLEIVLKHRQNVQKKIGTEVSKYGKKVLIVTGRNSAKKSGLLDRNINLLKAEGVNYTLLIKYNRIH